MSRKRTSARHGRTRRLVFLAVFVGAALVGANFARITAREHALGREMAGVQADIALLELQNAALRIEVERRKTNEYIVQKARELGYVKPGEGLATIRGTTRDAGSSGTAQASVESRIERWLRLFIR